MTPDQLALWQRIESHPLDDPAATLPFTLRLARENRWSLAFARRAVAEYRRFAFLAVAAGHPVSPPDAIDQVWHLHLLYTHDYWGVFCPHVLRTPLHHGPTRGGRAEGEKFADWYARTRASYRRHFGEPPVEIWPARPAHPEAVRIDASENWIVPKPRLWARRDAARTEPMTTQTATAPAGSLASHRGVQIATALALVVSAPRAQAAEDLFWPFNLPGPEFLGFYAWFAPLLVGLAFALRWYVSRGPAVRAQPDPLDPYEVAQLAGGEPRVIQAVLASLRQRGLVEMHLRKVVRTAVTPESDLPLLEQVTLAAIAPDGSAPGDLRAAIRAALEANRRTLVANGLLLSHAAAAAANKTAFMVALLAPVIGLIKVGLGLLRDKPVLFVAGLSVIALVVALLAFRRRPRLTARGRETLVQLERDHARLASLQDAGPAAPSFGSALPLAVGLFGLGALSHTAFAGMEQDLGPLERRRAPDGSSGCSSTVDTGTSESSGGDGGGGDGGSGCGGCSGD